MKTIALLLLACVAAMAQSTTPPAILKGSPPGGIGAACSASPKIGYLDTSGRVITCASSIWTVLTGGGGVTSVTSTIYFTFDGGGTLLNGAAQTCKLVPSASTITGIVLTSEAADGSPLSGSATVDFKTVLRSTWVASGTAPSSIMGGSPATFSSTYGANFSLGSVTTAIAANTMLCAALATGTVNTVRLNVAVVTTVP